MANSSPAEARIEQLEQIEEDVINILKTSGNCLLEIAKDRPSQKGIDTFVNTGNFCLFVLRFHLLSLDLFLVMTSIRSVDTKLSEQIKYLNQVSTGHPHEGSSYPSQKNLWTSWHRLEHVKNRITELDRLRLKASGGGGQPPAIKQQQVVLQQQQSQQLEQQQQQSTHDPTSF